MPVSILRLNAKKSHPNDRITFIKPLKGPDEKVAQDFLERIAAQCVPIMKQHSLSIMTLEEYEPNREFVGRNFNGGEIIQLVLKERSGRWLPFRTVQMVMMHELAHCKQMNHSKYFWEVRNAYAEQMRLLLSRGYTGEGMWGRGALLTTGDFERNASLPGQEEMPEHLCGGAYRRQRRRKRKATGPELSWREKKERRILKKFGANGVALGGNDALKAKLEKGRRVAAAPKVAGSKRGRDLRANAALARFEQQKTEDANKKSESETPGNDDDETASGSETESGSDADSGRGTVRIQGGDLVDGTGRAFVKICEDDDPDDQDAAKELAEVRGSFGSVAEITNSRGSASRSSTISDAEDKSGEAEQPDRSKAVSNPTTQAQKENIKSTRPGNDQANRQANNSGNVTRNVAVSHLQANVCSVCSTTNDNMSVTCTVCANVLSPEKVPGLWKCKSAACEGSSFINAGDAGVCGACGGRKGA